MARKAGVLFILLAFVVSLAGCNTVKGAAAGAANGAKQDIETVKKTDEWMRKNLW